MSCPRCADSVGIRILGLGCSWWHSRQANDAVVSEQSIFNENQDYKFFCVAVNTVRTYISESRCAWWQKTDTLTHTHTRDNYSNPVTLAACMHAEG